MEYIANHLTSLQKSISELTNEQPKGKAKSEPQTKANEPKSEKEPEAKQEPEAEAYTNQRKLNQESKPSLN